MNLPRLIISLLMVILLLISVILAIVALVKADWYEYESTNGSTYIHINPFKTCSILVLDDSATCEWSDYGTLSRAFNMSTHSTPNSKSWYHNHMFGTGMAMYIGIAIVLIGVLISPFSMIIAAVFAWPGAFLAVFGMSFFGYMFGSGLANGENGCFANEMCTNGVGKYYYIAIVSACLTPLIAILAVVGSLIDAAACCIKH